MIQSWIGSGPNQPVSTDKLHQAIGPETVDRLSQNTGMAKGELLPLIAQMLPTIVDRLTPNQHVPDEGEISRIQSNPPIETRNPSGSRTRERRAGNARIRRSISLSRRDRVGSSDPAPKKVARCAPRHEHCDDASPSSLRC